MIFISGANGQLARTVISSLLEARGSDGLVVGTRDTQTPLARELAARGVHVRHADFRDVALMRKALQGVQKALFIPTYDADELRLRQNLNAIEAAKLAGVHHVAYASFLNAASPLVEHSRLVHYPTEQALAASGLGYTILRHALYADLLVGDIGETLATGAFRRPGGKARCAYVARADLGYSAAQVLMRDEPSGHVYSETMEQAYSGEEVAALMAAVFGRPVRYEPVAAADTDLNRGVTLEEFTRAAALRFQLLDIAQQRSLTLPQLQAIRSAALGDGRRSKRSTRAADTRIGNALPSED
jgi:NAD(P)H dehydrogenase (quinone)